jgi:hypothetical protein
MSLPSLGIQEKIPKQVAFNLQVTLVIKRQRNDLDIAEVHEITVHKL